MRNIRLELAYDGTDFHGWQRQPKVPTVQETLEVAIQRILGEQVTLWGSGRTDAGVHALNQVANFKTNCRIPCENLLKALNDVLPPTVRVKEAQEVSENFHARYDARSKTYRYRILQAPTCPPFIWRFVCHCPFPLDRERMAEAARLIEGEHDFTSFASFDGLAVGEGLVAAPTPPGAPLRGSPPRRAPSQAAHGGRGQMLRKIFSSRILWRPHPRILIYEVCGSGFLHHMVRNLAGTLMEVGKGKLGPQDIVRILEARDRTLAGPTAPAQGLCLVRVEY